MLIFLSAQLTAWSWPFIFVALVPLAWTVERAATPSGAVAAGVAASVGYALGSVGWFPQAIATYTQLPWEGAFALFVVASPLLAAQWWLYAAARFWLRRSPLAIAGAVSAFVGAEWGVARLFGETLGQALYPSELLSQGADLAGVRGLTVAVVLFSEAVVAVGSARRPRRATWVAASVVAALAVYGVVRRSVVDEAIGQAPTVRVAGVQASLTGYAGLAAKLGTYDAVVEILDVHAELSAQAMRDRPQLLVWPETVYPTTFGSPKSEAGAELDRRIVETVRAAGIPLLFGAYDVDGGGEYNAAFLLEPEGRFRVYRKANPFPLTEYVPWWLDGPRLRSLLPWSGSWSIGRSEPVLLTASGLRIAPLICYDAVSGGPAWAAAIRGAEVIVTLSNDSWFEGTPAPRLHLAAAAFRSIETRRAQLRVTNSGISAAIDPVGRIVAELPFGAAAKMVSDLPRMGMFSLAVHLGPFVGPIALAVLMVSLLHGRKFARRR